MPVFLDYGPYWYEDWQPVQFLKSELYPHGRYADSVSYYFPPGVRADVTLVYPDLLDKPSKLGFGRLPDENTSAPLADIDFGDDVRGTSLSDTNQLYVWGDANLGRSRDMVRYAIFDTNQAVPPDDDNVNGRWKDEPNLHRMDFGETVDVASGYSAANNYAIWHILSHAHGAHYESRMPRLPGANIVHSNLEGAGELVGIKIFIARVKITQVPANLDKQAGAPEVWRAGRISFGHF